MCLDAPPHKAVCGLSVGTRQKCLTVTEPPDESHKRSSLQVFFNESTPAAETHTRISETGHRNSRFWCSIPETPKHPLSIEATCSGVFVASRRKGAETWLGTRRPKKPCEGVGIEKPLGFQEHRRGAVRSLPKASGPCLQRVPVSGAAARSTNVFGQLKGTEEGSPEGQESGPPPKP